MKNENFFWVIKITIHVYHFFAGDEEITALKKKLADAEAMMQQFMTQVTSTMQAAQEIRQSRSEDEWFVTN